MASHHRRGHRRVAAAVLLAATVMTTIACGSTGPTSGSGPVASSPAPTRSTSTAASPSTATPPPTSAAREAPNQPAPSEQASATCPLPATGFDCDLQQRIVAAQAYAASRPGRVGFVVRDRQTGALFRNPNAAVPVWTASTIKLAMVLALERWNDAGTITLTAANRSDIAAMLHSSDDDAADRLWYAYSDTALAPGAAAHTAFDDVATSVFGMTGLQPQSGFSRYQPYWGFQKCTADDLDALDQYLLTQAPADERAGIVSALQQVDPDQQWGVWGAGPAATPGNKDGWSQEQGGWVMNSVGFVGPDQRYTLAVMNSLDGEGDYDTGRATDTQLAATLFAGRF